MKNRCAGGSEKRKRFRKRDTVSLSPLTAGQASCLSPYFWGSWFQCANSFGKRIDGCKTGDHAGNKKDRQLKHSTWRRHLYFSGGVCSVVDRLRARAGAIRPTTSVGGLCDCWWRLFRDRPHRRFRRSAETTNRQADSGAHFARRESGCAVH